MYLTTMAKRRRAQLSRKALHAALAGCLLAVASPALQADPCESEVFGSIDEAWLLREAGIHPVAIERLQTAELEQCDEASRALYGAWISVELSRTYREAGVSPMAIQVLRRQLDEPLGSLAAERMVRRELVAVYRELGFYPMALVEQRRLAELYRDVPEEALEVGGVTEED